MTDIKITGELEKFSYSLGMSIAGNLIKSGVNTISPELFLQGITDTFGGEMPKIMPNEANRILEEFITKASKGQSNENLEKGLLFLSENKKKDGVTGRIGRRFQFYTFYCALLARSSGNYHYNCQ